jgi:transcription antitermination factor NusG
VRTSGRTDDGNLSTPVAPVTGIPAGPDLISSKSRHGGPRANSGGARDNSGGWRSGAGRKRGAAARPPLPTGPRWYCVVAIRGEQQIADVAIRTCERPDGSSAFDLFAPVAWRPETKARRDASGVIHPARPARLVPLFGRCMFVKMNLSDPDWHRIKDLDGVERIMGAVGAGGTPSAVPDGAIEFIRKLPGMNTNGCVYPGGRFDPDFEGEPIEVGVMTRILTGSMADHEGICEWSDTRRVRLGMWILGREVPTTLARRDVIPA